MDRISSVYGFTGLELDQAKALVEDALNIQLIPHESLYRGGAYYRLVVEDEMELILQKNYDCLDQELAEPEFPDMTVLLYVDGEECAKDFDSRLASGAAEAVLLRHVKY